MIITRSPFRVSFFGGGSDLESFYRRGAGAVLSTTIDRYMYLSVHPYFDGRSIHVKYSSSELAGAVADVRHPIVRRVLERLGISGGVEITSTADVPAGTGLGSSSAFTVGLLNSIYAHTGRQISVERLAREACQIEIEDLKTPIGKQDQYASAYGGLNLIRFFPDESVDVTPLVISPECRRALEASLLMFYTGEQRSAASVLVEQRQAIDSDAAKYAAMCRMVDQVMEAKALLEAGDVAAFGRLLDEAWRIKRTLTSKISNPAIDRVYEAARAAGAWGGKLLGAGGGGFLLLAAAPTEHAAIRAACPGMQELPVRFERGGSKVVYMSEEADARGR
ncbi:MAG TPA: GHMP kinase [Polyangia bacterium]|nr:GHMP kinase [Polyangia bacterium]